MPTSSKVAALVDVDGTLVDSNYHQVLAWHQAFQEQGRTVEAWRIHRSLGMGGDRLVPSVSDDEFDERLGDDVRGRWRELADEMLNRIEIIPGARSLLASLKDENVTVVLASSGPKEHVEHYVELLAGEAGVDAWTSSDDVSDTKPAPDLLAVALEKAGTEVGFVIGDSVWDIQAAERLDLPSWGLLTGGFGAAELRDAGCVETFDGHEDLQKALPRVVGRPGRRKR